MVLTLDNVRKTYDSDSGPVEAVRGISLNVSPGDFVALVGRSGCGKSTLLNLAGAMDFPTSGTVRINGQQTTALDDTGLTQLRRTEVGFIFQSFQLLQTLTAVENVELPLLLAGESHTRKIALERLAWVELGGLGDRLPHQLSGGQMQRVAIARALVHSPKLLLADEPTGNLDSTTSTVILQLLRRIATELNTAILMATHSIESLDVVDTVVHLHDGQVASREQRCPPTVSSNS